MKRKRLRYVRVAGAFHRRRTFAGRVYECAGCHKHWPKPYIACTCGRVWYTKPVRKKRQPPTLTTKITIAERIVTSWMQQTAAAQRALFRAIDGQTKAQKRLERLRKQQSETRTRGIVLPTEEPRD